MGKFRVWFAFPKELTVMIEFVYSLAQPTSLSNNLVRDLARGKLVSIFSYKITSSTKLFNTCLFHASFLPGLFMYDIKFAYFNKFFILSLISLTASKASKSAFFG